MDFRNRVIKDLDHRCHQLQLDIDGENVSDDSDKGKIDYVNLSFE